MAELASKMALTEKVAWSNHLDLTIALAHCAKMLLASLEGKTAKTHVAYCPFPIVADGHRGHGTSRQNINAIIGWGHMVFWPRRDEIGHGAGYGPFIHKGGMDKFKLSDIEFGFSSSPGMDGAVYNTTFAVFEMARRSMPDLVSANMWSRLDYGDHNLPRLVEVRGFAQGMSGKLEVPQF